MNNDQIHNNIQDLLFNLMPYGYLDLKRAINILHEIGSNTDYLADLLKSYSDECGLSISELDVVGVLYDGIMHEAKQEIEEITTIDFLNESKIYPAFNYLATNYDNIQDCKNLILPKLIESGKPFAELSQTCQWFLNEIEAQY